MADLIPKNTDEEMERYMEADMIRRARIPMEGNQALKFEHDSVTKRENALFPLSSGGYVKIGDRAVTPEQAAETDVLAAEREIQNDARGPIGDVIGGAGGPTMEDYEAAGFTEAEVVQFQAQEQARVLGQPGIEVPVQLTEEQMQFGEEVGADFMRIAEEPPGVFEGTLSEIGKGLVRGGIVEPSRFVKENFNLYDPLVFQVVDPRTGEFDPQLRIVSREEKAEIDRAIAAGEMPYAVDFEQLFERGDAAETGPGAALLGDISQFMGAYAGVGKLFRIGKGITGGMTQGAAADFFGFGGDEGRITDLLLELGVPDNMVTDFLRTDPNDPDYVGRFKNALEGGVLGGLIEQIGPVYRLIKEGGSRTQLGQAIGDLRARSEQSFANTISDVIGTGRAVAQGDTEMLGEIFQRGGTPRSLGAAGTGMDNVPPGATISLRADGFQNEEARQAIANIAAQRNPERPRVKIEDIASYHEQNHLAQYGRQLDPYNDQDFELAVDAATNEVRYQLDQAVSGQGWYDSDVRKTFEIASQVPGLESLATSETDRVIMSAIMAPTSIGQLVTNNTRAAIAAMLQYKRTGQIPTTPPAKGAMTEGIQNAGWGLKQGSVAANMRVISHLVDTLGPDGFADWWLSPHSLRELTEVRKAAGLSAGPSGLSGGQDSMHLGAMVIGDKTGRFSLNINGYEGTTKDVWFTRSYNRLFGNMRDNIGEVAGGPRNATERRRMEDFVRTMRDRLEDQGLSEQDIQAVMWYYEQNLMTDLGVQSRPGAFSEEAERIYGQLRPGVRGSDATEAAAEPGSLTGFRGVSPTQRTVRAERRLPQRVDPRDPTGQAGPYTRGAGSGDAGDGLLVLEPNAQSQARYQEAGLSLPTVREVPAAQSSAQYNADMTSAMAGHRFGAQVEIKSPEELADARLFRTDDGSGFAIKPDGDIVAVFAGQSAARGSGYSMLQAAVAAGGRKLDAFDTYLPKIYETAGFRPVARLPWNDEFAPPNWDKETFSNFNNGEPDVVFFVYDPDYYGGAVDVPVFNDYGDAVAEQDRQLQALGGSQ
jgi:hypothetical protein